VVEVQVRQEDVDRTRRRVGQVAPKRRMPVPASRIAHVPSDSSSEMHDVLPP
jgi:hypothetical protein